MLLNLLQTQKMLRDKGILISFSGRFSQGIIVELGEAVKKYMETEKRPTNVIYNVFAIFIELSQNIKNYTTSKERTNDYEEIANSGIANIGKCEDEYYIWAGNLVDNNDVEVLKQKLDGLLCLDKNELKKLYKEQLRKELPPESLGAGMGLIDVVRKANKPVKYKIEFIDNKFSFFEILVTV